MSGTSRCWQSDVPALAAGRPLVQHQHLDPPPGRERVRLQAAEWFEAGESTKTVPARLRVHERSVTRWRKAWWEGGTQALLSKSRWPEDTTRISAERWAGL
ncbi:helix-turn-helix domain-containing protein [Nonomuraea sp. C10]|uniref:helix-turn-helix domain-containing protein n=1 Tax=Nonomuraea sp. C10 TaxID=2600577 RepID=UPI001C9D0737